MDFKFVFTKPGYSVLEFDDMLFQYRVELKERRLERGYTVLQLADLCGVSDQTIYNIENGLNDPSLCLLIKLCSVLECSCYELLDIHDIKKSLIENRDIHVVI